MFHSDFRVGNPASLEGRLLSRFIGAGCLPDFLEGPVAFDDETEQFTFRWFDDMLDQVEEHWEVLHVGDPIYIEGVDFTHYVDVTVQLPKGCNCG